MRYGAATISINLNFTKTMEYRILPDLGSTSSKTGTASSAAIATYRR
jgi:hypothetical protein